MWVLNIVTCKEYRLTWSPEEGRRTRPEIKWEREVESDETEEFNTLRRSK
jgi:hypothetical protein